MRFNLILSIIVIPAVLFAQNATEIVKKADQKMRGATSQANMVIRIVRPSWSREMEVKTWMKGTAYAMILIKTPARDKGTAFLKKKKEVWNWLPTLERTIKLPPSMMSQSWMGTDFTNDDLVKESSVVEDYAHSIVGDTVIAGRNCYIIQLIPKPEAAVVWGKLILCIDKQDFLELYTRFYDEQGTLQNTMRADEVKIMDGRLIPTRMEMVPADKAGQRTEIIYKSILFDRPLGDDFFSVDRLKQQQ